MAMTTDPSEESTIIAGSNGHDLSAKGGLLESLKSKSFWRDSAPKGITDKDPLTVWSRHLVKRREPHAIAELCETSETPHEWGITLQRLSPRCVEMLALANQFCRSANKSKSEPRSETVEQILSGWHEGSRSVPHSLDYAIECLVVANLLPKISGLVKPEFWWELADALWQIVESAREWHSDSELPPEQGVTQQLVAGELPLTLAYLFPEVRKFSKLRSVAYSVLTEGIGELTNGNGLVQGGYLEYQRPLLACWTRCCVMGELLKKGCWSRKANDQFEWMVTHALGLSSPTGLPLLSDMHEEMWSKDFLKTVISMSGDKSDAEAARSVLGKKITSTLQIKSDGTVPETSANCEWAGVAYMRAQWEKDAPLLAVDYSSPDFRLECWSGRRRILSGAWTWEATLDGKRLEPEGTWDETCWFSDDDVDYLELSLDLSGGARLERQILLARDELFLLLCDYVLDTRGGKLCHRYRLPLDSEVEFEPEKETREGVLTSGKTLGRVLPLALPEWRADPRVGQLTASNGRLQLEQEREGRNMACPLLIDLHRTRSKKPCTWRQLTVAQALEIQTADVAVGYRAQCGKDQWLIYRSLMESANRTVLGQNLSNECLVARFLAPEGEVDELLEIK